MKCFKCGKEMDRKNGSLTIKGWEVTIEPEINGTSETIDYRNTQLGRYSDGHGGCHVAICYECHIDGLFHIAK